MVQQTSSLCVRCLVLVPHSVPGSQATNRFNFFTAAQLHINVCTNFRSYLNFHKTWSVQGFCSVGHIYIYIICLMVEKAIWLDIARVCVRIFMSRRQVKIQHKSPISSHIAISTISPLQFVSRHFWQLSPPVC